MDVSDQDLLRAIASGDRAAFGAFYDRHAPRVLGLLVRLVRHRADADEVLQDTFWQVWTQAGQYDPDRAAPQAWLVLIARSRAFDLLRRRARRTEPAIEREPCRCHDAAGELAAAESSREVHAAVSRLPDEQRQAVWLAFFGGLTHDQIARQQGIPLGTVKTRIRLGMRRLREMLHPEQEVSVA